MRTSGTFGIVLLSIGLLTACGAAAGGPPPQAGARTISGTLTAPASGDVRGTYLITCPIRNDDCDWDNADAVVIESSGRQAPFTSNALPNGEYAVIAWKDNEPKNQFGAEDYLGVYSPDQRAMGRVRPAAGNISVTMMAFSEAGNAAPPSDAPRTAVPADLAGKWSTVGTSGGGYYNPATGAWSSAGGQGMWYEVRADGTFVFSSYIESNMYGCNINFFKYHTGTVAVQGDRVTFTATKALQRFEDTCNSSRNYEKEWFPKPDEYQWGVGAQGGVPTLVLRTASSQDGLVFRRSQ